MAPPQGHSGRTPPAPFRGGPPPPVVVDESRSAHPVLAPMDVDRPPHMAREHLPPPPPPPRDGPSRGPLGQNILLRHPSPRERSPPPPPPESRASIHNESYFTRTSRPASTVTSSPTHARRSPPPFPSYPPSRQSNPLPPPQHSPRVMPPRDIRRNSDWEHRQGPPPPSNEPRDWERRPAFTRSPPDVRMQSPAEPSPRSNPSRPPYWEQKPLSQSGPLPPHRQPSPEPLKHRYDPRFDQREEPEPRGVYAPLARPGPPPSQYPPRNNDSNSRAPTPAGSESSRRNANKRAQQRIPSSTTPAANAPPPLPPTTPKEETTPSGRSHRNKRLSKRSKEDENMRSETPKPYPPLPPTGMEGPSGPRQSRTSGAVPPSRVVDEDYDEGVAETLMGLKYRVPVPEYRVPEPPSNLENPQPVRQVLSHRGSLSSSSNGHASPPTPAALKRPSSPGADELVSETKRQRMDTTTGPASNTPGVSTRPSPIPFRTQPTSRSPEMSTSPPLPSLPPHPRPVGLGGLSSATPSASAQALPPIATLSPESAAASPVGDRRQDSRSPPLVKSRAEDNNNSPSRASPASP